MNTAVNQHKTDSNRIARRAQQRLSRYWQRKFAGRCVDCEAGLPEDAESVRCVECKERQVTSQTAYLRTTKGRTSDNARHARKRQGWKSAGLCVRCGAERDRLPLETCSRCAHKFREAKRNRTVQTSAPVVRPSAIRRADRHYQPIDELEQNFRVRILRALYWLSVGGEWSETREIWQAAGMSDDYDSAERNSGQVALGRLVKRGLAERQRADVKHSGLGGQWHEYRITETGRAEVKRYRRGELPMLGGSQKRRAA